MRGKAGLATTAVLILAAVANQQPGPRSLGLIDQRIEAPPVTYRAGEMPLGLSATFRWGGMPRVMDQGNTPRCVSFSASTVKAWQDKLEWGKFFNFDEAKFANQIGTTAAGAYMSTALGQLQTYGYPVVNIGDRSKHRIVSYRSVPLTAFELKRAIQTYGPVLVIGYWYDSWWSTRKNGTLRAPTTLAGGHAWVAYGWDNDRGIRGRNSWGTDWGLDGDFFLPYSYLATTMFGAYVTVDEITVRATTDPAPTPSSPEPTVAEPPTPTPSPSPTVRPETSSPPAATVEPSPAPEPEPPVERESSLLLVVALVGFALVSAYVLLRKP